MSITGPAGGEPTKVGVALVDVLTGRVVENPVVTIVDGRIAGVASEGQLAAVLVTRGAPLDGED